MAIPRAASTAEGLAACAALADGLDSLSRERIGAEMRKLLLAPDPAPAVAAMEQAGILARVLPGAAARALPVLVHLEGDATPSWLRRLAVLGGEDALDRLRLSRAEAARLDRLRAAVGTPMPPPSSAIVWGATRRRMPSWRARPSWARRHPPAGPTR